MYNLDSPELSENVRVIASDFDLTLAARQEPVCDELIDKLHETLLEQDRSLIVISNNGLGRLQNHFTNLVDPSMRQRILLSPCRGAEVWGFDGGDLNEKPLFSIADEVLTGTMPSDWRNITNRVIEEWGFRINDPSPIEKFKQNIGTDPMDISFADHGSAMTLAFLNGSDFDDEDRNAFPVSTDGIEDIRSPVVQYLNNRLSEVELPVVAMVAGKTSVDLALKNAEGSVVTKADALKRMLGSSVALEYIGMKESDAVDVIKFEVWGDTFRSTGDVMADDAYMTAALPIGVRSIDFSEGGTGEYPHGMHIVQWPGPRFNELGVLDYLSSR